MNKLTWMEQASCCAQKYHHTNSTHLSQHFSGRHKTTKRISPYLFLTPPVFEGEAPVDPSLCVGQFERQSTPGIKRNLRTNYVLSHGPCVYILKIDRHFFPPMISKAPWGMSMRWATAGRSLAPSNDFLFSFFFLLFFFYPFFTCSIFLCQFF